MPGCRFARGSWKKFPRPRTGAGVGGQVRGRSAEVELDHEVRAKRPDNVHLDRGFDVDRRCQGDGCGNRAAKPVPAKSTAAAAACVSTCTEYQKSSLLERIEAIKSGCPNYISAISDPVVARIRLAPEVAGSLGSAVDDELWLEIAGRDLWHRSFRNEACKTCWKKDVLKEVQTP